MVDVVFVHGIRGGAFATWRREGLQNLEPGHKTGSLDHQFCWPSEWLPQDVPQARLLSMEYAAPASGWEVSTASALLTLMSPQGFLDLFHSSSQALNPPFTCPVIQSFACIV